MSDRVHFDDHVFRELLRKIGHAAHRTVKVGVLGGDHGGDISMVELAAVHEFGSPSRGIPERSFIRSSLGRDRKADLSKVLEKLARAIINDRMEVDEALEHLGLWATQAVKRQIVDQLVRPRLEESEAGLRTIKRKGSDVALVDSGLLLNAITWQVDGR